MPTEVSIDLSNLRQIMNDAYYPLLGNRARNLVLVGGAGSGKSYFIAQKIVLRLMREFGHHFIAFRKVARTLKISVWLQMREAIRVMGVSKLWRENKSEMTMTFIPNGNVFRCMGMDDQEKLKSIVGMTGAWMEEATEFTPMDYEQINLRLRGRTPFYKQIILSFNPISALHWIKGLFFDRPQNGRTSISHTTYRDNRFLEREYVRELEEMKERDPALWRIYAEGIWGVLKGLIFDIWPNGRLIGKPDQTIYGLDFGFNNPTALVRIDLKDRYSGYLKELIYEPHLKTVDLIQQMRDLGITDSAPIYADAAEPDRIQEIYDAGFNVYPANKGQGSVSAGINAVRQMKLFTNEYNVNINRENATYKWREDKSGNLLDEPLKMFDHAMDAIRMAIFSYFSQFGDFKVESI